MYQCLKFVAMAGTKETIQRKKEFAKLLYSTQGVTSQRELATRVGVSEVTISKWVNKERWETLRANVIITKEQQLKRFYDQVVELNDAIAKRPEGERYASSSEADTLIKITRAINELETETNLSEAMEVLKKFIIHIRHTDFAKAQEVTDLADEFIKTLIK